MDNYFPLLKSNFRMDTCFDSLSVHIDLDVYPKTVIR